MLLLFYNLAHIGDLFDIQQIVLNIIRCNPEKNIKFYTNYNHFILNDISNNLLFQPQDYTNPEIVPTINWLIQTFYQEPEANYRMIQLPNKEPCLIVNTCLMRLHRFKQVTEMDPWSFQESYLMQLEEMKQKLNIDIKYTKLSALQLLPQIPTTNIDSFLKWKATNTRPTLFYYNILRRSNQQVPCMTFEEHEEVILHIAALNPDCSILVCKLTDGLKNNANIISCEDSFDCKEVYSCENVYKINKILCQCDYSVHYDIGTCMTYINTDFYSRKNKLLHFYIEGQIYYHTLTGFLSRIMPLDTRIEGIKCKTLADVKAYFSKNLLAAATTTTTTSEAAPTTPTTLRLIV